MNLSALPAPLRTLVDAPQDWMEDGQEVNGELTLRSDGTTLGPGRKKGPGPGGSAATVAEEFSELAQTHP